MGQTNQTMTLMLKTVELLHIGNLSEKRLPKAATLPHHWGRVIVWRRMAGTYVMFEVMLEYTGEVQYDDYRANLYFRAARMCAKLISLALRSKKYIL